MIAIVVPVGSWTAQNAIVSEALGTSKVQSLSGMLDLFPALSVSWNELDMNAGVARSVVRPDPGAAWYEEQRPLFSRLMHQSPLVRHLERTGSTRAVRWEDVADPREMLETELYARFYAPLGINNQLVVSLPAPPGVVLGLAVNRGEQVFSDDECALLEALRPHVLYAYRSVCYRVELKALRAVAAEQGWQVLLVDSAARVLEASRTWLALADGGTNERLAARLGISAGTVRKHLERVFVALDVRDRASAAARICAMALEARRR